MSKKKLDMAAVLHVREFDADHYTHCGTEKIKDVMGDAVNGKPTKVGVYKLVDVVYVQCRFAVETRKCLENSPEWEGA